MLLPIRLGDSNRSDLQAIATSLLQAKGDAFNISPGSTVWIEAQAQARAIYEIWAVNQKLSNQFDPMKMSDFLPRWEAILSLTALPSDTLVARRTRVAAKLAQLGTFPNTQAVIDLLSASLPQLFVGLRNIAAITSTSLFPGGVNIAGGSPSSAGPWFSSVSQLAIELHQPSFVSDGAFQNYVNELGTLLGNLLPAYDTFDWFSNQFTDNGSSGHLATITVSGSSILSDGYTHWNTNINSDGTKNINFGSILECFDDHGLFQQMIVNAVVSDTAIHFSNGPLPNSITNQPYWIAGFFLDCDPTSTPYPNSGTKNLDMAGITAL